VLVESFFQKPGQATPAPPPVAPPVDSATGGGRHRATSSAAATGGGVGLLLEECAECRWRAIQEQLQTRSGTLQQDRLFPARSIPMMVAEAASGLAGDSCGSEAASDVGDDACFAASDDYLCAQLESDDLWDELCSADPPCVVYATSTAALTVIDASKTPATPPAAPRQQHPASTALGDDLLQSPAGSSALARSSSSLSISERSTAAPPAVQHPLSAESVDAATGTGAPGTSNSNNHTGGAHFKSSGLVVHAASLNRLIQLLTPENGRPDATFNSAFFMTYSRFTTTAVVVRKLLHRFLFIPASAPPPHRVLIRVGVLRALAALLASDQRDLSPADAKRIALLAREARAAGYQEDVDALEAAARTQQRGLVCSLQPPQVLSLGLSFPVRFHELGDIGLVRLHQQFCLVEYSTYDAIEPRELLVNWESPRTAHLAPNLRTMVRRFNAITNWATSLVLQAASSDIRTQVVDMLLQLSDYMRQSNNFQVLNAILAGMSKSLVAPTVNSVLAKRPERRHKFQELMELMESGGWVKLMKACNPPFIPFFGKFQSDLVHIDDSMRDIQPDGQIVVTKQMLLHRTISEMLRGKGRPYLVKIEPCLHFYVQTLPDRLPDEQLDAIAAKPRPLRTTSMHAISRDGSR